ncbi:MAG TPA: carbamoyltransferase N-terminal domain-containing protein, partial [Elusimicrobiales bacterium]|nr:carbamoyltransferase N-terminal domain-containing protein [Elusimicrobiales bacterium]
MKIIGIACHTRDSAVCLLDGESSFAARERCWQQSECERFPLQAFNCCLQSAGLTAQDIDYAVFHEKPFLHFASLLTAHIAAWPANAGLFLKGMPLWLEQRLTLGDFLRAETGFGGQVLFARHHAAHAAAAFYPSDFERAAVLVMDSGSESDAVSLCGGEGNTLSFYKTASPPHSPAVLCGCAALFLGFGTRGEDLLEGAASCGNPVFEKQLLELVARVSQDGTLELNREYFNCGPGKVEFSHKIREIFGPSPAAGEQLGQRHFDIAASVQSVAEQAALAAARALAGIFPCGNLCLGGGLFSNAAINSRLREDSGFHKVFVPDLPGNAGTAPGAALYARHCLMDQPRDGVARALRASGAYSQAQLRRALISAGLPYQELSESEMADWLAERLSSGRIVAWFHGGSDFS